MKHSSRTDRNRRPTPSFGDAFVHSYKYTLGLWILLLFLAWFGQDRPRLYFTLAGVLILHSLWYARRASSGKVKS